MTSIMLLKLLLLSFKNLRRNRVRAVLTALALVLLASVFCMIATVLFSLHEITAEKSRNIKLLITERYRIPSRFDRGYVDQIVRPGGRLYDELSAVRGFDPQKYTVWQVAGFTLDPEMRNKDLQFMIIATHPEKIPYMTDDLEGLDRRVLEAMKRPPKSGLPNIGVLTGATRLARLGKRVGDVFKARSFTHLEGNAARRPIEMEFEVVGTLPGWTRWADLCFMDYAYLSRVLQDKKNEFDGKVDIAWLVVDDQQSAEQVSRAIEQNIRDVKCETMATAVTRFMAPIRDFLWGIEYVLAPAILLVMVVIIANAIGITVRERTAEVAVLKVLGFRKGQILALVLCEGVLLGALGGLLGGGLTQGVVTLAGGIPISMDRPFFVSAHAWWWGPTLGAATALLGGIIPAWNACRIKVSEVFARVA
jgi:putative ABC transport system permease protein